MEVIVNFCDSNKNEILEYIVLVFILPEFEILDNPTRKKIILEFFGHEKIITYNYIKDLVNDETTRPDYHLTLLVEDNLIKRVKGRGNYQINETMIQPLRKILIEEKLIEKVPICLIGGLGEIDLPFKILDELNKYSLVPKKYFLLTSPNINRTFDVDKLKENYQLEPIIHLLDYETELKEDYDLILKICEDDIITVIHNYELICDLTGGTKLVTLGLVELADKYHLQKFYYSGQKLKWF